MSQSLSQDPRLIVALDFADLGQCLALVKQLDAQKCRLKVGKEMFTRFGPSLIEDLQKRGFEIFLDLKFHDIPNTVNKAVAAAADLGVWMLNVHAGGGLRMMEAAKAALSSRQQAPLLVAVTVLTSLNQADLKLVGIDDEPRDQVARLAALTKNAGLDGVVCSAQELDVVKKACGKSFVCVTPGIRPSGSQHDDQSRVMSPSQALAAGSDYLVIGRPITQADDPAAALGSVVRSLEEGVA